MKVVLQRVRRARVEVDGKPVAEIGKGFLILVGVRSGDSEKDAEYLAEKCFGLRAFEDEQGKMNLGLSEVGGSVLAVSQFTLYGDCRKGRRPSFTDAAPPEEGKRLYEHFVSRLRDLGAQVQTGQFGARMQVELVNDGPVTFVLDSEREA
jgi:D-tyrosyl-tRNA(Tyr) deacylase